MSQHNKPFNLAHAKAGAPVQLRKGISARILCYDKKGTVNYPILALFSDASGTNESPMVFSNSGQYSNGNHTDYDLVMAPLAVIEDKPVFVGDVLQFKSDTLGASWHDVEVKPDFAEQFCNAYRWPKPKMLNIYQMLHGTGFCIYTEGCPADIDMKTNTHWEFVQSIELPAKK